MEIFDECCTEAQETVNGHELYLFVVSDEEMECAIQGAVAVVPAHYASLERLAEILDRFGKESAAAFLNEKIPTAKKSRSGDLGEIIATEYIDARTNFAAPIKRLRWKDHRQMAMRGDDVIGISVPNDDKAIQFLKSEVKSRASLSTQAVQEARSALDDHGGLPSPHALGFVADRLREMGQTNLSDLIDLAQLRDGISADQVTHLMFAFTGNSPKNFLKDCLATYAGDISQHTVGFRVGQHQAFIARVFELVSKSNDA